MGTRRPPSGERGGRTPRTRRRAGGSRRSWPASARSGTSSRRSIRPRSARRTAEPPATDPSRRAAARPAGAREGAGGAPPSPRARPRRPGGRRPPAHGRHRARGARGPSRPGGRRGRRTGRGPARTGSTGQAPAGAGGRRESGPLPVEGVGQEASAALGSEVGLGGGRQGHGGHGADQVSPACSPEVSQEVSLVRPCRDRPAEPPLPAWRGARPWRGCRPSIPRWLCLPIGGRSGTHPGHGSHDNDSHRGEGDGAGRRRSPGVVHAPARRRAPVPVTGPPRRDRCRRSSCRGVSDLGGDVPAAATAVRHSTSSAWRSGAAPTRRSCDCSSGRAVAPRRRRVDPMPVDAPPLACTLGRDPFALTVAGEAWREVVVEAEPSATIGDLADALGLDPAGGLEVAGDIVDRSRRLTLAGLRQGDVLRPGGPPSLSPAPPPVVEVRWVTGFDAGRVDATLGRGVADRLRSGRGRRRVGGDERRGHGARSQDGSGGRAVGGRLDLSAGTAVVSPPRTVTRHRAAYGPRMDGARRAITPPARSEAAGTGASRPARRPDPPGLAVPGAGHRVAGRRDRAGRRPAAGARAHARRLGRRRHPGHVRVAEVAVAATADSLSSCPRCGVGRASGALVDHEAVLAAWSWRRHPDLAVVVDRAAGADRRAVGDAGAGRRRLGGLRRRGEGGRRPYACHRDARARPGSRRRGAAGRGRGRGARHRGPPRRRCRARGPEHRRRPER